MVHPVKTEKFSMLNVLKKIFFKANLNKIWICLSDKNTL